jgi:hypothetical protein
MLVVPMIGVLIRRHVGVIGLVDSHQTSQPRRGAGRDIKRAAHHDK